MKNLNFHTKLNHKDELSSVIKTLQSHKCISDKIGYGTIIGDYYSVKKLQNSNHFDLDIIAVTIGLYLPRLETCVTIKAIPKVINFNEYLNCNLVTEHDYEQGDYSKRKVSIENFESNLTDLLTQGERRIKMVYEDLEEILKKYHRLK